MAIAADIAALFTERFPRYAFSLSEWTPGKLTLDPIAFHPSEHVEVLYLFKMGDARALFDWLGQKSSRRLIFLEPDSRSIVAFLQQSNAKEILEQRQIEIYHLPEKREKRALLQELSERYPVRGVFVEPGAKLSPQERRSYNRLRLQLLRKTALTHANFVDRLYGHIPLFNLLQNLSHLPNAFYVNRMKDAFQNIPAIICGAGPSLEHSMEELRRLDNRALIIAGGSAITALSTRGIIPHFAVAIDPNPDEMRRLQNSRVFEGPFLFSSRLYPDVMALMNGPFGYMRSGMAGIVELWLEEELNLKEPILGQHLPVESLSVTTLCAAIADHLGCNPIIFDGLDLAYTENRRYAAGVEAGSEKNDEYSQPVDRLWQKKDRQGKKIVSAIRWVMESAALSKLARRRKKKRWINGTQGGIGISGIDVQPLKETIFEREWDLRALVHSAIHRSSMPVDTKKILEQKTDELRASLNAVVSRLGILIKNENAGKCALAEIELKDELAYSIMFFDIEKTLQNQKQESPTSFWQAFLEIAQNYQKAF